MKGWVNVVEKAKWQKLAEEMRVNNLKGKQEVKGRQMYRGGIHDWEKEEEKYKDKEVIRNLDEEMWQFA